MSNDLSVQNEGSIFLLRANTNVGQEWLDDHIGDDAQTWGGAIVIEHRYITDVVSGAINDGLTVGN
jgi:hypothetical protein